MAKKQGAVSKEEKHDQKTSAEIALITKQSEIQKFSRKKKFVTMGLNVNRTIIQTTDPKKWAEYEKARALR